MGLNGLHSSGSGWGQMVGSCQHSNELHIPQNAGNFLIAEELLVHREVPYSM